MCFSSFGQLHYWWGRSGDPTLRGHHDAPKSFPKKRWIFLRLRQSWHWPGVSGPDLRQKCCVVLPWPCANSCHHCNQAIVTRAHHWEVSHWAHYSTKQMLCARCRGLELPKERRVFLGWLFKVLSPFLLTGSRSTSFSPCKLNPTTWWRGSEAGRLRTVGSCLTCKPASRCEGTAGLLALDHISRKKRKPSYAKLGGAIWNTYRLLSRVRDSSPYNRVGATTNWNICSFVWSKLW